MRILAILSSVALLATLNVQAASLSVMGDWFATIGESDVVSGAGSDIRSAIESSEYQAEVSIADTGGAVWALVVSRSGANLPTGVTLAVRRTGNGSCGSLTGGTEYRDLTDQDQLFFSGLGDCSGIGIQLRLQGVSVQQAPGLYGTTVHYTVQ
jgi:hypothetical protein